MSRSYRRCSSIRVVDWVVVFSAAMTGAFGCAEATPPAPSRPAHQKDSAVEPAAAAPQETMEVDATDSAEAAQDTDEPVSNSNDEQMHVGWAALSPSERKRADSLYEDHCAACHGAKGDGEGIAARFLFPKPRNFQSGFFRLASTTNNVPTLTDLDLVLVRGMPGSSMPPWPKLDPDDRRFLAERVMEFRREGIRERERKAAEEFGEPVNADEVAELVGDLTTPGPVAPIQPLPDRTPESIARGREVYLNRGCVACHAIDGTGRVQQKMVDAEGFPATARDLTRGIFKGNPDEASIYRRTQTGIPGTPMPATGQMTHEEISDLVHFVLSLSDEKTRNETILNRTTITAFLTREIPENPEDSHWKDVEPVRLRMTPLWWRNDFHPFLEVRAVHDGRTLALSLSWADEHPDTSTAKVEAFRDAVAVQLFQGEMEPFLGMGAPGKSVEAWLWDARRQPPTMTDVEDVNPNIVVDNYPPAERVADSAEYARPATRTSSQNREHLSASAAGNPFAATSAALPASSLEAGGPGSVTFRPPRSQLVRSNGAWKDGRWTVVLVRPLSAEGAAIPVPLKPGDRASLAFAVWDGGRRDRDGMKLITIWQDLVLQPEQ